MGVKTKMALAAASVIVVAFGVSGYAGALPRSAQNVAHTLIGAPAASKHAKPKHQTNSHAKNAHAKNAHSHGTPVGPDAKGSAAYGLCNAYKHSHKHGNSLGHSIAMRNLARAAGGAGNIAAYCATVPTPSKSGSDSEQTEPSETEAPETEAPETEAPEPSPTK